jgi:hypothetical protein
MKYLSSFILIAVALFTPTVMASGMGGTVTKTYLHHLDRPGMVTCHQGQTPDKGQYATPTVVVISMAALSIPTQLQNFKEVRAYKQLGFSCKKLTAYIASFKNEFGTIPVTVRTLFSKQAIGLTQSSMKKAKTLHKRLLNSL